VSWRAASVYLLRTQKKIPLRPKNQRQPKKRMRARMAVAIRRKLKKVAVRSLADD
jgi:hypothetical protein